VTKRRRYGAPGHGRRQFLFPVPIKRFQERNSVRQSTSQNLPDLNLVVEGRCTPIPPKMKIISIIRQLCVNSFQIVVDIP
jgi:hypothetical protein